MKPMHRLQIRPIVHEGTPYHSAKLHPGPCSSMGIRRDTDTQTAVTNMHFASATPRVKCNDDEMIAASYLVNSQ